MPVSKSTENLTSHWTFESVSVTRLHYIWEPPRSSKYWHYARGPRSSWKSTHKRKLLLSLHKRSMKQTFRAQHLPTNPSNLPHQYVKEPVKLFTCFSSPEHSWKPLIFLEIRTRLHTKNLSAPFESRIKKMLNTKINSHQKVLQFMSICV